MKWWFLVVTVTAYIGGTPVYQRQYAPEPYRTRADCLDALAHITGEGVTIEAACLPGGDPRTTEAPRAPWWDYVP